MRVLVVTNMYPDEERPTFGAFIRSQVDSLRQAGAQIELLFIDGRDSDLEYARAILRVRDLAGEAFDLLHAHYGLTGFVAACQSTLPMLITFHGDDLLGTPTRPGHMSFKSRLVRRLSLLGARRATALIVQSRDMLERLPATLRGKARVLPMGIDLERFQPLAREVCCRETGLDPARRRIAFLGDPDLPVKRFALAAAAARIVCQRFPDTDLHVVSGRPPAEVPLHLNASDVLLVTSIHEGGPNVVREALACNLPVVSVAVGDVAERIGTVPGCHLVPSEVEPIAAALEEVLALPGRVPGRATVEPFSLPRVAQQVLALYAEVASARTGRR
jgi:glycosyltransferase involved in cell wall biosynthesis